MDSATFTAPTVVGFAKDFVFTRFNGKEDTLLKKQLKVSGYPTTVLFKPDGKEIDRLLGYFPPDSFMIEINNYLAGINTLDDYLQRLNKAPDDPSVHYTIGEKYSARCDYDQARTYYTRVIELDQDNKEDLADDATYQLAYLARKANDWYKAIDGFRMVIDDYPDSELREDAEIYIPWLYAQAGDSTRAVKYYRKFLKKFPESEEVEWVKEQIEKIEHPEAEE
jgi:tetratricopeptide (TPR) repeat protein